MITNRKKVFPLTTEKRRHMAGALATWFMCILLSGLVVPAMMNATSSLLNFAGIMLAMVCIFGVLSSCWTISKLLFPSPYKGEVEEGEGDE